MAPSPFEPELLTHGALYAHFPSKDALAAEAFSFGSEGNMAGVRASVAKTNTALADEVLQSVRKTISAAYKSETAGRRR